MKIKTRAVAIFATALVAFSGLRIAVGSAAPLGLNKCVTMLNPGLAPWAMDKYRPFRAHCKNVCIVRFECVRR